MTSEYKYQPPLKFLLVGLGGFLISIIFGSAIGKAEIWFSIIVGIFCFMSLAMGIGFLTLYFKKINTGKLKIGQDFIEIPGRWKKRTRLNFDQIQNLGEFDTYDRVIEIQIQNEIYLIERQWMRKDEFEIVKEQLCKLKIEKPL